MDRCAECGRTFAEYVAGKNGDDFIVDFWTGDAEGGKTFTVCDDCMFPSTRSVGESAVR